MVEWGHEDNYKGNDQKCYLALGIYRSQEKLAKYVKIKTMTKVVICEVKLKDFKEVFDKLYSKEGEKEIYIMVLRANFIKIIFFK